MFLLFKYTLFLNVQLSYLYVILVKKTYAKTHKIRLKKKMLPIQNGHHLWVFPIL